MDIAKSTMRQLAARVLLTAYQDLSDGTERMRDDAAWFFVEGKHRPWCDILELDPDEAVRKAREAARGKIDVGAGGRAKITEG